MYVGAAVCIWSRAPTICTIQHRVLWCSHDDSVIHSFWIPISLTPGVRAAPSKGPSRAGLGINYQVKVGAKNTLGGFIQNLHPMTRPHPVQAAGILQPFAPSPRLPDASTRVSRGWFTVCTPSKPAQFLWKTEGACISR